MQKRIIATLIVKDGIVVQSICFKKYLPVGKPEIAVEFLNNWGIDEIIILDIEATKNNRLPDTEIIKKVSKKCFVPLTVGGGIKKIEDVEILLQAGADKICLNYSIRNDPSFICELAAIYGNQFVVASIDVINTNNEYLIYDYFNCQVINASPFKLARMAEQKGAGELFINSVHKDGMYSGYDVSLMKMMCDEVHIPIIASGGAKNGMDILKLLKETKVSAASASNFFHFYEHSVTVTKGILARNKIPVRNESYADYTQHPVNDECRLLKKDDMILEDMRFVRIEKEII